MSETSLSPALTRAFEGRVDPGSWAGFIPLLARFLGEVCGPPAQRGESAEAAIDPSDGILLLTVLLPTVRPEELVPQRRWSQLLTRPPLVAPPVPSPDLPGVVLVGRPGDAEVSLSELDAQGRVLLGPIECRVPGATGRQENHYASARLLSDADEIADLVAYILTEVLRAAHPADLDYLLRVYSDIS